MPTAEAFEDIGSLYDNFFDQKRKPGPTPQPGQVVFCPVLESDARPWIADVKRVDSVAHNELTMHIRPQEKGDFLGKSNRLPIKGISLDSSHELVITRAKQRPCLVIGACCGVDPSSLPDGLQKRHAAKALGPIYLLAPLYSVATAMETGTFGPIISARIRCLMYPEFFYVRQSGGYIKYPSVARLDRVFARAPHAGGGFEAIDLFIMEELTALVREQLRFLLGHGFSREYLEIRELMMSCLPSEAK